MEMDRNITDLPLEILDLFFEYCGDMSNKVHLAQTHPILVQAFVYHCRNMFECVTSDTNISLSSWRFILPVCGSNIKKIHTNIHKYSYDDVEFVSLIALHCSSLEEIKIQFSTVVGVDCVLYLIHQRQSSLRDIGLSLFYAEFEMNPDMLGLIPELPLLESLNILNITVDNYYDIHKFKNLVELEIGCTGCINIDILVLCSPLKKLRTLTLRRVRIIGSEENQVHLPLILPLEKLYIFSCNILMKEFPECFNLKILNIYTFSENSNPGFVERLILSQRNSLESLSYNRKHLLCNNEKFIEIIRACRKLRYLNVPFQNINFDRDFDNQIVDILKKNGVTPHNLLVVATPKNSVQLLRFWHKTTSNPELITVEESEGQWNALEKGE